MNAVDQIKSALRRLDLSEPQQRVYLSLITEGQATPRTLAARTRLTRPSVYDQLKSLLELGLVNELDIENKAHFAAADLRYVQELLNDRIDRLEQSRNFLDEALPSLKDSFQTVDPKVRFFTAEEGMKNLLKDLMWHDRQTIQVVWNPDAIAGVYEKSFLKWFDERRSARNLVVHSLWSRAPKPDDAAQLNLLSEDKVTTTTKLNPADMSYLIYANKVAFISSNAEAFGFIVESAEFTALQKMQFDCLLG